MIDIASKDITDRMGGFERTSLLINVFSKSIRIPGRTHPHREDKEDVVAKALTLAPSNPTINEIQQIAGILSEFPVGERDFVFKKYKELQSIRAK